MNVKAGAARARLDALPTPVARGFGAFERRYHGGGVRSGSETPAWALEHLVAALGEAPCAYLSLGVFDTLLLRNGKSAQRRAGEIAERWVELLRDEVAARKVEALDVVRARLRAAEICYACGPVILSTQEGRLDNIIEISLSLLGLPAAAAQALLDLEIAYEFENTTLNPLAMDLVTAHRAGGGQVILVSDTCMPAREIRALLTLHGLSETFADQVFSSADMVVNKRTGTIFNEIAGVLGSQPDTFFHVGDNVISDYTMPRYFGWRAQHLPVPQDEERLRDDDERAFKASYGET